MKHQWKTDDQGNVQPIDRDADHPIAECILCGTTSGCLDAGDFCTAIGADPRLDADDCEGLDLTVEVQIIIRHPGKATVDDDRSLVRQGYVVPLAQLIDGQVDLVELELRHQAAAMVNQWQIVKAAHHEDWERAVSAGQSAAVVLPGQHGTEER